MILNCVEIFFTGLSTLIYIELLFLINDHVLIKNVGLIT